MDANVQKEAANALFGYYLRKENYKEAEKYLEYFPEDSASRKRMQAVIYSKTGNTEGAYKAYEEILFSECNILNMVFNSLCVLSIKEIWGIIIPSHVNWIWQFKKKIQVQLYLL